MKVIGILWLRQLKRYFRSKARMLGSLGQPILFLVALGFGFGPIFEKAGGGNYLQFLAPGIIAMSILFTATFMGIEVIWDRQFGFLKETLVAPVPRWKIMLGRTLGGATVAVMQGFIVLLISLIFGLQISNWFMLPLALLFMFLIAILFTAVGTAIACLIDDMHGFQLIINFLIMPLFFLSGALFPLTGLPSAVMFIARLNPLSYGVDGLRETLVNISYFNIVGNIAVLGAISFIFVIIGAYLFSRIEA